MLVKEWTLHLGRWALLRPSKYCVGTLVMERNEFSCRTAPRWPHPPNAGRIAPSVNDVTNPHLPMGQDPHDT